MPAKQKANSEAHSQKRSSVRSPPPRTAKRIRPPSKKRTAKRIRVKKRTASAERRQAEGRGGRHKGETLSERSEFVSTADRPFRSSLADAALTFSSCFVLLLCQDKRRMKAHRNTKAITRKNSYAPNNWPPCAAGHNSAYRHTPPHCPPPVCVRPPSSGSSCGEPFQSPPRADPS